VLAFHTSSASIFCVQDKSDILGAVIFATDRGDTHISLDRIKDATIEARDLRIRLEFEGAVDDLKIKQVPPNNPNQKDSRSNSKSNVVNNKWTITSDPIQCTYDVPYATFDDNQINFEIKKESKKASIDIILYSGPTRKINFNKIQKAAIAFSLSITPATAQTKPTPTTEELKTPENEPDLKITHQNMSLTIPTKPMKTSKQRNAVSCHIKDI